MKRTELYKRELDDSVRNKVVSYLKEKIIHIIGTINYPTESERFLYFDKNILAVIEYNTRISDSLSKGKYDNRIAIEIMPPTAKTPKELSDLLVSKGFIRVQ